MISRLLALVALLLAGSADSVGAGRGGGLTTCPKGYIGGGMTPCTPQRAYFEFAPPDGAGMGTACSGGSVVAATGQSTTFTRASSAWCTLDDYSMVELAAGKPRVMTGTGGTSPLGVFIEDTATNLVLHDRDLSQAAWTKANVTCTKTATGVDGVASSASRCTATGAGGTVLQSLVVGAATRNTSMYLRRGTGTGAVSVTRDNGATWTDVAPSLSGSIMLRVASREAVGCAYGGCIVVPAMTSGGANPIVGIQLATNGDAVDVDLVQDEPGAYPTSPVTTGAASATRAAESLVATVAPVSPVVISWSAVKTGFVGFYETAVDALVDGTHFFATYTSAATADLGGAAVCYSYSGGGSAGTTDVYLPPLGPVPVRCLLDPSVSITTSTCGAAYTSASVSPKVSATNLYLGGGINAFGGLLTGVCVGSNSVDCNSGRAHPTTIAWAGDSITYGDAAAPSRPPTVLRTLLPGRTVYSGAVNSATVAGCTAKAMGAIASKVGTLVMLCGINNIATGGSASSTWATLRTSLDAARASGIKVVPVLLTPWFGVASWTAPKQAETDALNAYLLAWCAANGSTCVSTDSLGVGSPLQLQAAYDSGDHLHLSAAGGAALAALVQAANP